MFWLLGLESDRHWPPTAKAANLQHLVNHPDFASAKARRKNTKALVKHLDESFGKKTFSELKELFDQYDVWWTPVQTVQEVVKDPQAIALNAYINIPARPGEKAIKSISTPVNFSGFSTDPVAPVPKPGEHTKQILSDLGYPLHVIESKFLSKL